MSSPLKNGHATQYETMTRTPIPPLIVRLSIPTILSMLVTNIYNLVDTAFVGQLGNSASGAVGIVFGCMAILQAFGFMFGQGTGSIVSRLLGARQYEQASRMASTGFFFAVFTALLLEILCFLNLDRLVYLLGSTATIAPFAKDYIRFILLAAPVMLPSLVLNNLLRYEGKAFLGMVGLLTGAVLNIIADPILIFLCDMGISGAGLATALSQAISFSILLFFFLSGHTQTKLSLSNVIWHPKQVWEIMTTGVPSLLRQGLNSISTVLLNSLAGVYGDVAIAAMSIVNRVIMLVFSVIVGIGQGFQPVSGFNYGAKNYARVREAFRFTFFFSQIILTILMTLLLLFSGSVIQLFRDDPDVILIGTRALRLNGMAMFFLPLGMMAEMLLQSTGQRLLASVVSSLRNRIIFIPCLLLFSHLRGLSGIQEAQPVAFVLTFFVAALLLFYFFRKMPKEDLSRS